MGIIGFAGINGHLIKIKRGGLSPPSLMRILAIQLKPEIRFVRRKWLDNHRH